MKRDPRLPGEVQQPPNRYRRATGFTPTEFAVVRAVLSCQKAHDGYPDKATLLKVSGCRGSHVITNLVSDGWLESFCVAGPVWLYRGSERAWAWLAEMGREAA